jgi:hypothetical protein
MFVNTPHDDDAGGWRHQMTTAYFRLDACLFGNIVLSPRVHRRKGQSYSDVDDGSYDQTPWGSEKNSDVNIVWSTPWFLLLSVFNSRCGIYLGALCCRVKLMTLKCSQDVDTSAGEWFARFCCQLQSISYSFLIHLFILWDFWSGYVCIYGSEVK